MNKTLTGVSIGVAAILIVGGIVLAVNRNDGNPATTDNNASVSDPAQKQSNVDTSAEENSSSEAVQATAVDIKDYKFAPPKIQVKKGTAVTWVNQDGVRHDITPDQESEDFKSSELLGKGESYTFTFNTAGTYTYHCTPHPYMKGSVEVVE